MNKSLRTLMADILLLNFSDFDALRHFMDSIGDPSGKAPDEVIVRAHKRHKSSPKPHVRTGTVVHRFGKQFKRRGTIVRPFSKSLKELLVAKGMSQLALAKKIGINSGSVSHWLSGHYRPSPDTLRKLNRILGTSFSKE